MEVRNLRASLKTKKTIVGEIPIDWNVENLSSLCRMVSGGTPSRLSPSYWDGTIQWFSAKDLKSFWLRDSEEKITPLGAAESCRTVTAGTILILVRGMTLNKDVPVGITTEESAFNQDLKALLPNDHVFGTFLAFALQSRKHQLLSMVDHSGHGTGRLQTDLLSNFPIAIPPVSEQTQIAKILGMWDAAIEQLQKLIAAKKQLKHGLMQQLLAGQARFKEFVGERWHTFRLGELLEPRDRYVNWSEGEAYQFASIRRRSGGLFDRGTFYGREVKTKVLKLLNAGDFAISKRQVVHGAWAMVTEPFDGFGVSDEYDVLVNRNPKTLDMRFFNYLAQTRQLRHMALMASNGVHIEKLIFDFRHFAKLKVKIPARLEEQNKIADLLTACDREIHLLQAKLLALQNQKKGLMQKLLTGKVRVTHLLTEST